MIRYTFSKEKNREFARALKSRVRGYFREKNVSSKTNFGGVIKSMLLIGCYIALFVIILASGISNAGVLFALWASMGAVMAFVGTTVMHDSLHGSFSKNRMVNKLMAIPVYMIGANPRIWKIEHNVLHHTYTNLEHSDGDIRARFLMRFTPHQKRRWFHRWQHLYALFLYSLMTLVWVTIKDFSQLLNFRSMGLISRGKEFNQTLFTLIGLKLAYHVIFLFLPMIILPVAPWMVLLMFIAFHMTGGIILALIFQCAHMVPTSQFIDQEEELVDENWEVHQLLTTSDFARKNPVISWLFGGLNFQIEHHLFPGVNHVHYPKISRIVEETAKEYGIPYHFRKSFIGSVFSHFKLLKQLGRYDQLSIQTTT